MKRNLLMAGLVLLALASCKKEEQEGGNSGNGGGQSSNTVEATLTLTDSQNWKEDAAVGVYTADDVNVKFSLVEGAGTTTGKFKGSITKETTPLAAYIPYVEEAQDMQAVPVMIPATVPQENLDLARFQVATIESDGSFNFSDKLTTLKVSFANVEGTTYDGKPLTAITVQSPRKITGDFTANTTSLITSLSETYLSNSYVELTFPSGTTLNKDLVGYASVASYLKGGDKLGVSLIVDGKSLTTEITVSDSSAEGQEYEIVVDAGLFEPKIELEWAYGGFGVLEQFSATYPAIDNFGNVYVTDNASKKLTKISADGTLAWSKDIGYTKGSQNASPSIESDGSVIYVGGGSRINSNTESDACFTAFNYDGSVKWKFTDWFNKGNAPLVDLNQVAPAIGSTNVYIGNGGDTGTVIAIDKATGKRVSFVSNAGVTGGPTGGVGSGMGISKNGFVTWHCAYGTFAAKQSSMDTPQKNETHGGYAPWEHRYGYSWTWNKVNANIACLNVNGQDHVAACGIERAGSSNYKYKMHIICAPLVGSADNALCPSNQDSWTSKYTVEIKCQDQGGIIVGPQNELIVSLKNGKNQGSTDDKSVSYEGGLLAVNPVDGTLSWKFNTGYDVCGAAAVDNQGNVHVASDDGFYWILKPDYANKTATVVAKVNLWEIANTSDKFDVGTSNKARVWSSVMIGNDGKMYVAATFHKDWADRYGVVMCMQYAPCTGPGNTAWPMKGADARHSGNQK